jgi:hypothetical protein
MNSTRLISVLLVITAASSVAGYGANIAAEVKIGGSVQYCWWRPAWSGGSLYLAPSAELPLSIPYKTKTGVMAPAFMYGFTASARFLESWIFSSSLIYGNYFSRAGTPASYLLFPLQQISSSKDVKKYDFDALLGYRVNRYFSANLSVKTRSYNYIEKIKKAQVSAPSWVSIASARAEFIDVGPGLGIGVTIPLHPGLSLLIDVSGLVLAGSASYVHVYNYRLTSAIDLITDQFEKESFYSFAGKSAVTFEYYIDAAGLALQVGGSYDVIFYRHHHVLRGFLDYNGKYDSAYRVTFATVYTFTFGDDTEGK